MFLCVVEGSISGLLLLNFMYVNAYFHMLLSVLSVNPKELGPSGMMGSLRDTAVGSCQSLQ